MIGIIILVVSTSALARPHHYHDVGHYHGECQYDYDCSYYQACRYGYCENPCTGACGYKANCKVWIRRGSVHLTLSSHIVQVVNHIAVCACPPGYSVDFYTNCHRQ